MKGQISIIEAILSAVVLFIAFNMMITAGEYQTKWEEASNSLQGRDILVTADRLGKLHDYAFSFSFFKADFLDKIVSVKDSIKQVETQGGIKNTIYVACDCTAEQRTYVEDIISDVKFNGRDVSAVLCPASLSSGTINNCGASTKYPNVLIIWGYRDLTQFITLLSDFVNDGNGLIEIADIPNSDVDGQAPDNEGQKIIFGLKSINEGPFPPVPNPDDFLKPRNASQIPYQSYKWFYHLPYLLKGTATGTVPTEGGIPSCTSSATTGNFKFQDTNRKFWICGTSSVYWDTNENDVADLVVTGRNSFSIGISNFFLNYIDSNDKIRISFRPDYSFNDFIQNVQNGNRQNYNKMFPTDNNKNKILFSLGFWDDIEEKPRAGIIFDNALNGKAIWMADFGRNGLTQTGDDHKQLLGSLIFSTANKKTKESFQQVGEITSYINVNSMDILEIYKIDLSIGTPF